VTHGKPVYADIADRYAAVVDTKPYNAYYERPATLSVLPPLAGVRVLDAGCGSGWYAEHLVGQGAVVTAFDAEPRFVELTRARVGDRARVLQADLAQPLDFAPDASFDLVLCPLALHYVEDWGAVLAELARVLRPGGLLVFSTHHPFMDWKLFQTPDYFATELLEDDWSIGTVRFYRRPLTAMADALAGAGFVIERLVEPRPTEEFRRADPEGYEKLLRNPWFLLIRARRAL
jgi:SAM-dependent methyltransferase